MLESSTLPPIERKTHDGGPKISTAPRQPRVFSIFVLRPFINKSKDGDERRMLKKHSKKGYAGIADSPFLFVEEGFSERYLVEKKFRKTPAVKADHCISF